MVAPTFIRTFQALYGLSSTSDAGLPGYWGGYYSGIAENPQHTLSLLDAWNGSSGIYLFLNTTPSNGSDFLNQLQTAIPRLSPTDHLRVLWIQNPNDAWQYWRTFTINATPDSPTSAPQTWHVELNTTFMLGSYGIELKYNTQLTLLNQDALGYGIGIEAGGLSFQANGWTWAADASNQSQIPWAGPRLGLFQSQISLNHGNSTIDDFARLGLMLRYAAPSLGTSEDHFRAFKLGEMRFLSMPLLTQGNMVVPLLLWFDPINPLDPNRGSLEFVVPGSANTFLSAFSTHRGYSVKLTPLAGSHPFGSPRFVLNSTPVYVSTDHSPCPIQEYHFTLDGLFTITIDDPNPHLDPNESYQLLLGLSGYEYVTLPSLPSRGGNLFFQAGQNAYISVNPLQNGSDSSPTLNAHATTAYLTVLPAVAGNAGLKYYAQPKQAPLYYANPEATGPFLDYYEIQAASLPVYMLGTSMALPKVLPAGAYRMTMPMDIDWVQAIEAAILAPLRRKAIGKMGNLATTGIPASATNPDPPPMAVTPQGLVMQLTTDSKNLDAVQIAHMPQSVHKEVVFTQVLGGFRTALQSNQLFMVASNVDTLMSGTSVSYRLTSDNLEDLIAAGIPETQAQTIITAAGDAIYRTENEFVTAVGTAAGDQMGAVESVAGLLKTDIEGWTFQLSPRSWRLGSSPTVLIFKYNNSALTELIRNTASWGWDEVAQTTDSNHEPFSNPLRPTQDKLIEILTQARRIAENPDTPAQNPYKIFYNEVANNPQWNGVLFFNVPIDITEMPESMRFLAAGVDPKTFFAHHIGFSVTPYLVELGSVQLQQTAAFGLVDYNDPTDLVASETIPYGFKTMQLQVRFANAQIADFNASVELMINQFYSSAVIKENPARGNNLILAGSFQRVGSIPTYSFTLQDENIFTSQNSALLSVEVLGVTLNTGAEDAHENMATTFTLWGYFRFLDVTGFDLFSYGPLVGDSMQDGYLSFSNLKIVMGFNLAHPGNQNFVGLETAVRFDTSNPKSQPRPNSLAHKFPLNLIGLIAAPNQGDQTPEELGYTSISSPFEQTPMNAPWYGLNCEVDLGTLGALAGSAGIQLNILMAWSPGLEQNNAPVYIGIRIGNTSVFGGSFPLQGVLKLGFRSFQFQTYESAPGISAYALRLHRFALSILAWNFPPGNSDIILFGNPDNPTSSLGWYAAYTQDKPKEPNINPPPERIRRRTLSGRRTPPIQ